MKRVRLIDGGRRLAQTGLVAAMAAVLIAIGTAAFSPAPATAAPAERWEEAWCEPVYDDTTFCLEMKGVVHYQELENGNLTYTDNGHACFSLLEGGQVVAERCTNFHYVDIFKQGEPQLFHAVYQEKATHDGVTCTFSANVSYVNGDVRHEIVNDGCGDD